MLTSGEELFNNSHQKTVHIILEKPSHIYENSSIYINLIKFVIQK